MGFLDLSRVKPKVVFEVLIFFVFLSALLSVS